MTIENFKPAVYLLLTENVEIDGELDDIFKNTDAKSKPFNETAILISWSEESWLNMDNNDKAEIHEFIDDLDYSSFQYINTIKDDNMEIKGCNFLDATIHVNV